MDKSKILVVEDERIVGEDIKHSLLNLGYTVTRVVSSGKAALTDIESNPPNLVLMDIVIMGQMNGIETAERIRAKYDIPVVYLTAYADESTLEKAKLTQPFGYILKPYEERELQTTIETALYKHSMERKLRESEAWFSTTLKSIGDGVIVTDRQGTITFMNTVAETMTGWSQKDALGLAREKVFHIINAETREEIKSPVKEVLEEGRVIGLVSDTLLLTRDGREIPIDDSMAPIRDERGDTVGLVLVFHDIADRKRAEEALKESEERYRSIFEDSRDAIYITTRKGNFVIANESMLNLFGYSKEEISRINFSELFVRQGDWEDYKKEIEEKGAVRDYEVKLMNRNRDVLCCLITSSVRTSSQGEITGYQSVIRDITERKVAEEALRKSENSYRLLAENVTNIIWIMDLDQNITYVTPSVQRILGYEVEEMLHLKLRDIMSDSSYTEVKHSVLHLIETGTGTESMELAVKSQSDETVWLDISLILLPETPDTPRGILGVAHNITARKRTEEEKDKIQAQLVQAQKMEAIGILAGGIAHDFNNLLTVIQGNTDLAMMRTEEIHHIYQDLKEIQIATERAAELTSQLLMFSRKQPMKFLTLNFNQVVENMYKILHRLIGDDVSISTYLDPELWFMHGDRGTLEQVLMNLAVNARDAMPEGGKITLKSENIELSEADCQGMNNSRPGQFVCVRVIDEGTGIDSETISRIFEPFFSTKGTGKGTGLGLSVVYGIVSQHEGWLHVESELGKGTQFSVYFPRAQEESTPEEVLETQSVNLKGDGQRVFIIEDERGVRDFAKTALKEYDYQVFEADSADNAMALFQAEKGRFDLILSDVVLADRSGVDLVDEFLKINPNLHVLMCSGYTGEKSQWNEIQEKGLRFMHKPFTLMELLKTVKEALLTPPNAEKAL